MTQNKPKTPSARLRAVIWRLWESKGSQEDFEAYYERHINALIDQYKAKLPKTDIEIANSFSMSEEQQREWFNKK